jgi:tRNA pseudouridine55 synthase
VSSGPGGSDGIVLVDKPPGITSHAAIDLVRGALGTRRVGHAGTLDPMATGLLIMGIGRATRLLRFFGGLAKVYVGTLRLGTETDTLDADGEIVRTATVDATADEIGAAMAGLVGDSMQLPPAYSAVKVGGRKLYEAARAGEHLEAEPRPIRVHSFDLVAFEGADAEFRAAVSGGTYVRSLVADVGAALGCGAHLTSLRRMEIGPFSVRDASAPDHPAPVLPVGRAVAHLPRIELVADEAVAASHGRPLGPAGIGGPYGVFSPTGDLIGVYEDDGPKGRPLVILAPA